MTTHDEAQDSEESWAERENALPDDNTHTPEYIEQRWQELLALVARKVASRWN